MFDTISEFVDRSEIVGVDIRISKNRDRFVCRSLVSLLGSGPLDNRDPLNRS